MGPRGGWRGTGVWAVTVGLAAAGCGEASEPAAPELDPGNPVCSPTTTVSLSPGEGSLLPPGDSLCVAFDAAGDYALAFFDTASVAVEALRLLRPSHDQEMTVAAQAGAPAGGSSAAHPVALHPATTAAASAHPGAAHRLAEGPPDLRPAPSSATCVEPWEQFWCAPEPWEVGDRFQLYHDGPHDVEVVFVVEPVVVAVAVDQLDRLPAHRDHLEAVVREAADEAVPFLRSTLGAPIVTTSPGSGQMLVVVRLPAAGAAAPTRRTADGTSGMIVTGLRPSYDGREQIRRLEQLGTLVHEWAHLWQLRHARERNVHGSAEHVWALEGGATFVAKEYLRHRFAIPLETDRQQWPVGPVTEPEDTYWNFLHFGRGELQRGYGYAQPFLRHLLIGLVRAGTPYEEAMRRVVLGSVEGWGVDPRAPGLGLTSRMGEVVGAWSPVEAVLAWTLANALDDRAPGDRFQNRTVADAWRSQDLAGWPPEAALHEYGGRAVTTRKRWGSSGYFEVATPGGEGFPVRLVSPGGTYPVPAGFAPVPSGVRWMVARIR